MANHLEIDASLPEDDREIWSPQTQAEVKAQREAAKGVLRADTERRADLDLIRAEAQTNPAFAALAKLLGIETD